MQPGLLIAIATAFCVGFLFGYFVRAMVSWRRRRRFSRRFERASPDHVGGFRLKRLAGREEAADPTSLAAAADAPSLAELHAAVRTPRIRINWANWLSARQMERWASIELCSLGAPPGGRILQGSCGQLLMAQTDASVSIISSSTKFSSDTPRTPRPSARAPPQV